MQIGTDDPIDDCLCHIELTNFPNQELKDALVLLKQIIDNILEHPNEEKYLRLNKANPKLQEKLFKFNRFDLFLQLLGFNDIDNTYQLIKEDHTTYVLEKASKLLTNRIRNFQVMVPLEEHPKYDLIKARMDEKKELDSYKKKLVEEFQLNKEEVWREKNWDPKKYEKQASH